MTLAGDSILVTPGSGATVATHTVDSKEHQVVMQADDGAIWFIEGGFKTVFIDLAGARVWIVGDRRYANNTKDGEVRSINVTEYGVIRSSQQGIEIR